ncbi:Ger(x)C family spore germination protein [Paenibacillus sp. NPDC056579]|uniref:Ger(x)C family spore germination protein n=1 Tax=Paenibacillus sp. NPDC056579 TaxID=3345871 RepID=UPI0036B0189A
MANRIGLKLTVRTFLIVASLLVLSGCWDIKDINHRALPIVMGISKVDGDYKVYLQVPEPYKGGMQMRVVSGTGTTISEIVDRISANMESSVDLLHLKIILLDKSFVQQGVNDSIASFMRSRDISAKTMVVICSDNLETFFEQLNQAAKRNSTVLYDFFENSAGWNPQIAQTRVWELFRSIHSFTHDVAIPIVKAGRSTPIESDGSAVIKNGKMVDRISMDETLLFNAFKGLSTQGRIEVLDHASVLILNNRMSHKSSIKDNKALLNSRIQLKVTILETKDNITLDSIRSELQQLISTRFQSMFRRLQAKEADILGVGQYFRNKVPRDRLASWRSEYYPSMKLNLEVNTIIQNQGNLRTLD